MFDEMEGERLLMIRLIYVNSRSEMRPSMRRVLQILNEAEVMNVPVVKPKVSFSASMPMSVKDLVSCSDDETDLKCFGSYLLDKNGLLPCDVAVSASE
ncbi:hypothetical protein Tco_1208543 [Tanacetum coccineum]